MAESQGPASTADCGVWAALGTGMGIARALAMHLTIDWC